VLRRRWNIPVWLGSLIALSAPILYFSIFLKFPALRDRPSLTLLIFGVGLALMALGIFRAYQEPWIYRGRVLGTILAAVSVAVFALFGAGIFYFARQFPPSRSGPKVGQKAPDFALQGTDGRLVTLADLLSGKTGGSEVNGAVLIFYRGDW
jgi:hypothetical protein